MGTYIRPIKNETNFDFVHPIKSETFTIKSYVIYVRLYIHFFLSNNVYVCRTCDH
jgi:hypothetical protein